MRWVSCSLGGLWGAVNDLWLRTQNGNFLEGGYLVKQNTGDIQVIGLEDTNSGTLILRPVAGIDI
jgi:hypothetical protein